MIDLPQHAAQVSIIRNFHNPAFGFFNQFQLHWFIPYSLTYYLAALFAVPFGVLVGIKIMVSLAVLGLPLSLWFLMKETGGDRYWSLLGIPLAYGYSFYWGFLSHIVALPLGVIFVAQTYRFNRFPNISRGLILAFLSIVLFFSHAIVFAMCMLIGGSILVYPRGSFRDWCKRLAPLLAPLPLVVVWMKSPHNEVPKVKSGIEWAWTGLERLNQLFPTLLSNIDEKMATRVALALFVCLFVGARFKKFSWATYVPFFLSVLVFYWTPHHAMDISLIYQRLAIFVALFFLVILTPISSQILRRVSRGLIMLLVVFWVGVLTFRFHSFNAEAKDFDKVLDQMEPNKSVLALTHDTGTFFASREIFNHFPAYYQAFKGGKYSFSFAFSFKSVARYVPGQAPLSYAEASLLGNPELLSWPRHGVFDYYVIRSVTDRTESFLKGSEGKVVFFMHQGPWWVYKKNI